ncbi:MAG: flavodoxin domain-containing protein [Treponema sp.]|nr:flavodoxin domain-containing protein [Candidatus Treponema equifaecale]
MKTAIVYATTTGNTEQLANAAKETAGTDAYFSTADVADSAEVLSADLILLGSPAMGAEQLEDSMEAFFSSIEGQLSGKKVVLFGSYDWGGGQFIDDWAERVSAAGAEVTGCVKAQLAPDENALSEIKSLIK